MKMDAPKFVGFNFQGGLMVSPEFIALLMGLVLYTAAFVAEVVRAGIQSVSKGQREAAMSIGLRPSSRVKSGYLTPSPQGHYSTLDEPDAQPDKEQFFGRSHWLSGFCLCGQHNHESDRTVHRGSRPYHGGVSVFQSVHLSLHELV